MGRGGMVNKIEWAWSTEFSICVSQRMEQTGLAAFAHSLHKTRRRQTLQFWCWMQTKRAGERERETERRRKWRKVKQKLHGVGWCACSAPALWDSISQSKHQSRCNLFHLRIVSFRCDIFFGCTWIMKGSMWAPMVGQRISTKSSYAR